MRSDRRAVPAMLLLALALSSCGGTAGTVPAGTGHVSVYLTDAPSYAFDNVWVTVKAVWFHKVETAPYDNTASGWVRFPLDNGATVNLAALPGDSNVVKVFDNLALPAGTYRQILLFLAPTEGALMRSASDNGLAHNNQVDAGPLRAALRVPNATQGIRIADRVFQVDNGALLRIAIDLDVGRDVVPVNRGGISEFILKPRLRSFDLDNAGAIVGSIDLAAAADKTALFEVKAEQVDTGLNVRVVRRAAAVDNNTGRFVLYPLDPGSYDLVIRGIGHRTCIVTGVGPVARGSTPAMNPATFTSPIAMDNAVLPDYRIGASLLPASSRVLFYQTMVGDSASYEIRVRHVDPFTGRFDNLVLSNDPILVAAYNSGSPSFAPGTITEGSGGFTAIADAPFFGRGLPLSVTSAYDGHDITISSPSLSNPRTVSGTVTVPSGVALDNGVIFVVHGGQVVTKLQRTAADTATGPHPYSIGGIPGGFEEGFYGVTALGWSNGGGVLAVASPSAVADLRSGPDTVDLTMTR
ncbi:MAG: DUF4382 domain-containing protein, partial [Gemmatimonadota bacterium]